MIRILQGDCREMLATLPDASVQCCVTSPPYYALRDYGTAQWDGGDAECDHLLKQPKRGKAEYTNGHGRSFASNLQAWGDRDVSSVYRDTCGKCGARRIDAQIGLEATPDEYIAQMVAVFREVRRVLRPDGVLFLNIGDSYAAHPSGHITGSDGRIRPGVHDPNTTYDDRTFTNKPFSTVGNGYKPKDLMMMPARVALALQADGWWLRSDIIWAKPNPMPESVTDRCITAHEHIFMLTKSARYFFDSAAIAEPAIHAGRVVDYDGTQKNCMAGDDTNDMRTRIQRPVEVGATRSCRNVWTIATEAFPSAHFATYPTALVERCVKAATSERGCCAACGAPHVRITTQTKSWREDAETAEQTYGPGSGNRRIRPSNGGMSLSEYQTTGWAPTCTCNAAVVPCTVLDCFAGAFTTALVADRLQRHAIGIELSPTYCEMARNRLIADAGMFAEVA